MGAAKATPTRSEIEQTARGRNVRLHDAAHDRKSSFPTRTGHAAFWVHTSDGGACFLTLRGRVRWALEQLLDAGADGCTPILTPAPRWSAYVHSLRSLGVEIETIHEPHAGDYPGHHGRYVLRCRVLREGGGQ